MNKLQIIIIASFVIFGCNREKESNDSTISVNVKESKNINIQDSKFDILKLNDNGASVLLGNIKDISFYGSDIIIETTDGLFKYDGTSGKKVITFGGKGRARNEYINMQSHWVDSSMLHIYDMNGKKILSYNMDGESIASYQISSDASSLPFQLVIPYYAIKIKCIFSALVWTAIMWVLPPLYQIFFCN